MTSLALVFVCVFASISATTLAPAFLRFLQQRGRGKAVAVPDAAHAAVQGHVPYEVSGRDPLIVHLCNRPDVRALTSGGRVYFA